MEAAIFDNDWAEFVFAYMYKASSIWSYFPSRLNLNERRFFPPELWSYVVPEALFPDSFGRMYHWLWLQATPSAAMQGKRDSNFCAQHLDQAHFFLRDS